MLATGHMPPKDRQLAEGSTMAAAAASGLSPYSLATARRQGCRSAFCAGASSPRSAVSQPKSPGKGDLLATGRRRPGRGWSLGWAVTHQALPRPEAGALRGRWRWSPGKSHP